MVWYFEHGGVVLGRWRCGTLKRAMWYFEEGVCYFEEGGVVLLKGRCVTLKRVL